MSNEAGSEVATPSYADTQSPATTLQPGYATCGFEEDSRMRTSSRVLQESPSASTQCLNLLREYPAGVSLRTAIVASRSRAVVPADDDFGAAVAADDADGADAEVLLPADAPEGEDEPPTVPAAAQLAEKTMAIAGKTMRVERRATRDMITPLCRRCVCPRTAVPFRTPRRRPGGPGPRHRESGPPSVPVLRRESTGRPMP